MTNRDSSSTRPHLSLSVLFILGTCGAAASQAQKYTVSQLAPPPGESVPAGVSINNAGVVVGSTTDSNGNSHAVEWNNGVPTIIYSESDPESSSGAEAVAINNQGIVIGDAYDFEPIVFEIGPNVNASMAFDHGIGASAISDTNVIVGDLAGHPAIWSGVDLSQNPGFLPTTDNNFGVYSLPTGVNAAGIIVGTEYDNLPDGSDTYPVAVRWRPDPTTNTPGATVKALGGLGGQGSGASAVNASGWIVGWATLGNNLQHAVLWEPTTGAFDLGTLGGKQSGANGINAEGDVVGQAQAASGAWHAVLWTHKHFTATDLNLEISQTLAKQFTLTSALGTNDRCMVLVNGVDNKTGVQASFVLTLTNQSQCNVP